MNWTKNETNNQFYTYEAEFMGHKINVNEVSGVSRNNNELMVDLYMFEVCNLETQFYYHGTESYSTLDEAKSASISWIKENK